jgi:AraC family transcriptional regulator
MPDSRMSETRSFFQGGLPSQQVIVNLLAEARTAIGLDPTSAYRCLDGLEQLLLTGARAPAAPPEIGGLAAWQAKRVTQHIDANLTGRLQTAELAGLVNLSENHFARAFKKSLGCPPHAFVVRRRMEHAQRLIVGSDAPLAEVALDCGLADQAHLSRLFRRFFDATPSSWRRQHRFDSPPAARTYDAVAMTSAT